MTTPRRATAVRRLAPLSELRKDMLSFFDQWSIAKDAGTKRDKSGAKIRKFFESVIEGAVEDMHVSENENGSLFYDLDEPVTIHNRTFEGLEYRKKSVPQLDVDRVEDWLDTLPEKDRDELAPKIFNTIVTVDLANVPSSIRDKLIQAATDVDVQVDEGALYGLQQQGLVPDKMLDPDNADGFIVTDITWSLYTKMVL